jgi:hypothetical protein
LEVADQETEETVSEKHVELQPLRDNDEKDRRAGLCYHLIYRDFAVLLQPQNDIIYRRFSGELLTKK